MNNSIYPVLGAQMKLPFYVSGVGISDPEYHVVRSSGLVSYQILYTRNGAGVLEIDGRKLPQIPGSIFLVAPGVPHEYYPQQDMWETAWVGTGTSAAARSFPDAMGSLQGCFPQRQTR